MSQIIKESGYLAEPRTKMLCERWKNRIAIVESTLNAGETLSLDRKAALAKILENTQALINSRLCEGVQSSDIGQYKRYALDIVTTVVPNLIAYDIVSVQPIENRVGMINYIKYVYNTNKGKTEAGSVFADGRNMYASDKNYTARLVEDEVGGTAPASARTAVTATLAWAPVIPGTVTIAHGDIVITDNGNGGLTAAAGISTGTIDYATGDVAYTLTTGDTDVPTFTYQYNNEFIPAKEIPEIGIKIESLPITATTRRLKAFYAFEAAFELQKEYGSDMQELLNTQAAAEIAHEIDMEICDDLYAYANAGTELVWSKAQPVGVSLADHYDSFVVKVEEGSAAIHQATRRVRANFIIAGTSAGVVISTCRTFKPSGETNVTGPYFAGTLGNYRVYINPEFSPNAFVLGYKGDNLLNAGYVYAPYMPVMTTDLVQLEDMAGRKGWATMYGKLMLNDKFYIKGRITA